MAQGFLILAQFGDAGGGGGAKMLVFMGLLFAVMYFVMIRPQSKQMKEHRNLLASLKKGDDVVTQSGIFGRIYSITDKQVMLEVANNVRIRILKSSIQGPAGASDESAASARGEEKKEEK